MTDSPPNQENANPGELERVLEVLRRRAGLIFLCMLFAALAAFAFSKQQTKEYTATASLVFDNGQLNQRVAGLQTQEATETPAQQSTRVNLLQLGATAARTAKKLGHGITATDVKDSVSVTPQGESNVVDIAATWTSPEVATRIANTYSRQYIANEVATNQRYFAEARKLVEKEYDALSRRDRLEPLGSAVQDRLQGLTIMSKLNVGEARIARPASLPSSPSSPRVGRNTIIGALLGLLLGLLLAFMLERLNRKLREPEEAREAFGLPVLGTVPESRAINASNKGTAAAELPFMENEAFRMLRASLRYFNVDRDMRTILVTSHSAGVGKSTISWNLGRVGATSSRAVVVESDLRNPTLAHQHDLEPGPGLSEVLTRQVGLDAAIQFKPVATGAGANGNEEPTLHVVTAGAVAPNPAELLESRAMEELLTQLKERYELVIIDTAPIGIVSDCFPLLRQVDGVIGIARMGKSTRDSVGKMREQLDRLDAPTLGIVANGLRLGRRGKHRYGYDYYGTPTEQAVTRQPVASGQPSAVPPPRPGQGAPEQA